MSDSLEPQPLEPAATHAHALAPSPAPAAGSPLGWQPAKGWYELDLTVDFFASDFVPAVCLFSGTDVDTKWRRMFLEYRGYPDGSWWRPTMEGNTWRAQFSVPARWWPQLVWRATKAASLTADILAVVWVLFFALIFAVMYHDSHAAFDLCSLSVLVIPETLLLTAAWWLRRRIRNAVQMVSQVEAGHIQLRFPPAHRATYELYAAFYHSYVAAHCPAAEAVDRDEGWEDKAAAGWDEGGRNEQR